MTNCLAAVIFDFDGVILDSETAEYESHRLIYERCGVGLTPAEWCDQIGIWVEGHEDRWASRLLEHAREHSRSGMNAPPADSAAFKEEQHRLFHEIVSREPMRGVRALIEALGAARVPMAIASSAPARWVVPSVERLGLSGYFAAIVTAHDIKRRKPAPDAYLEAARRLGVAPERTVAIEDSGPGLAAAAAAGMRAVAIPHWLTESHDLTPAALRVAHAGELTVERLAELVTSPRPTLK